MIGAISIQHSRSDNHQDVVITMLPYGHHVWEVFTGAEGLLRIRQDGHQRRLFMDCSTIDTATSKKVGAAVAESGLGDFADAPVSVSTFAFLITLPECWHRD